MWVGRDLKDCLVPAPCHEFHWNSDPESDCHIKIFSFAFLSVSFTTQSPRGIWVRSSRIFCPFPVKLWAVWCFTFEICRVPIPVCGSNTPPARALWLKNHWKFVSFLRFAACLKSTFRSQNTFDFLILGHPNVNHHLHHSRIWDFPFFVKMSAPNKPSYKALAGAQLISCENYTSNGTLK